MVVPVLCQSRSEDYIFLPFRACPKAQIRRDEIQEEDSKILDKEMAPQIQEFVHNLTRTELSSEILFDKPGDQVTTKDIFKFRDALMAEYFYFGKYPSGIDESFFNAVNIFGSLDPIQTFDNKYAKFGSTKVISAIYNALDMKIGGLTPDIKYYGMSGHDDNMMPI